jgi:Mn-dependent DtxR family transcriptional regulator
MDILESGEDYLERILMLEENKGRDKVHAIDLATSFSYSKASVSLALKKLTETGYLSFGEKDALILTTKGREKANSTYERHKVISQVLISLGVNKDIAAQDACKIEHDMSEETFQALKEHYLKNKDKNIH